MSATPRRSPRFYCQDSSTGRLNNAVRWPIALGLILLGILPSNILSSDAVAAESPSRSNVILVLADDLGYGDLGCFGHPTVRTPNLDRLASAGLRLTSCYSAGANCSPSRAGLMTGRTPYRVGIHNQIPMLSPMHLPADEVTIATLLRRAGYSTCHSGKWHLNGMFNLAGQPQPGDHGFDHWFSTQNNCLPNHHDPYDFARDSIPVGPLQGYAAELVVDEAIHWLNQGRAADKPFFMYVCFHEPHEPIHPDPKFTSLYDFPDDPSRAHYYGSISQMDHALGRLMVSLDQQGLADNTLVWFTSDNGPARTRWHNAGSAGPLREFKGHMYEGGIRIPGIIRWPGHVKPGSVSDVPVCGTDFLPTVCDLAGIAPPSDRTIDGESVRSLLDAGKFERAKPLFWEFVFAQGRPAIAMRQGDWKILADLTMHERRIASITEASNRALKHSEPVGFELYNLRQDIGETTDLAATEPGKLRELTDLLLRRFHEIQRETPVWPLFADPGFEQKRIVWPDYLAKPLPKAQK